MISNEPKNSAIRAYEIMKEKGYTPEEIETFLAFLNQNTIEVTQPLVERMDHIEMLLFLSWSSLALLILIAPGALQKLIIRFLPARSES